MTLSKIRFQAVRLSLGIIVALVICAGLSPAIEGYLNQTRRDQLELQLIADSQRQADSLRAILEYGRPVFAWYDSAGNYWCEKVRNPIRITKREYDSLVLAWDRLRGEN